MTDDELAAEVTQRLTSGVYADDWVAIGTMMNAEAHALMAVPYGAVLPTALVRDVAAYVADGMRDDPARFVAGWLAPHVNAILLLGAPQHRRMIEDTVEQRLRMESGGA